VRKLRIHDAVQLAGAAQSGGVVLSLRKYDATSGAGDDRDAAIQPRIEGSGCGDLTKEQHDSLIPACTWAGYLGPSVSSR
jgi:hypothetical protein